MRQLLAIIFALFAYSCSNDDNLDPVPFRTEYIDSAEVKMTEFINLSDNPKAMQGMTVYGDRLYQFYNNGRCRVFDMMSKQLIDDKTFVEGHYGSVEFSDEYENPSDELPLLYIGGRMEVKTSPGYTVLNMNQGDVKCIEFDSLIANQVLCAFDFKRGVGYNLGYKDNDPDHEFAPYEVTPFDIATGKCDIAGRFFIKNEGHLQDATFVDGNIWVVTGWGSPWNGVDVPIKMFSIDVEYQRVPKVVTLGWHNYEAEGIAYHNGHFLISMRKSYKVFDVTF